MITIAIVEDQKTDQDLLKSFVDTYKTDYGGDFSLKFFSDGQSFLEQYKSDYNIVFMDIDMPGINGFDTAVELRKKDSKVVLIFITNLNKYAIKGYSVNAFDYISKPVNYFAFSTMFKRAITKADTEKAFEAIISSNGSITKVDITSITYIEVRNHQLIYHTDNEDIFSWASMSSIRDEYLKKGFAMANISTLINLRRIHCLNGSEVILDDENKTKLYLSRSQRKDFAMSFTEYLSGESK